MRATSVSRLLVVGLAASVCAALVATAASAARTEPWQDYQRLDTALFDVQLGLALDDRGQSRQALGQVTAATDGLAGSLGTLAPVPAERLRASVAALESAVAATDETRVAVAVAGTQTAALAASFAASVNCGPPGERRRGPGMAVGSRLRGCDPLHASRRRRDARGSVAEGRRDLEQTSRASCRGRSLRHVRVARALLPRRYGRECSYRLSREDGSDRPRTHAATGRSSGRPTSGNAACRLHGASTGSSTGSLPRRPLTGPRSLR